MTESLKSFFDILPSLIREASSGPLGILALVIVISSFVAVLFFRSAPHRIRIPIFLLLLASLVFLASRASVPATAAPKRLDIVGQTPWKQTPIPRSGAYKGHVMGVLSITAPRGSQILPDTIERDVTWDDGNHNGVGWGNWHGAPEISDDGRTVSLTYDHYKHDRGVIVKARAKYQRVWTPDDTVSVWLLALSIAILWLVIDRYLPRRQPKPKKPKAE